MSWPGPCLGPVAALLSLGLGRSLALLFLLALSNAGQGVVAAQSPGFLIISAPRSGKVSWVRLPENGSFAHLRPETLVDEGLRHPQGIAVDQKRKRLFVADPDVQTIFSYQLIVKGNELRVDGRRTAVSRNAESRWVAVDGTGNLFFSDEPRNMILKVSADKVFRGDTAPEVVYSGSSFNQVNEPGGVAVDNFHIYWTNKHFGLQAGSVVRGSESPSLAPGGPPGSISILARNTVKSYGVCLALGNIYYTNSERSLFGVKRSGGPATEVTSSLSRPRGCTWDGDGTVFVADRDGAVYSFAGNMHTLGRTEVKKAFAMEDAFGIATLMSAAAGSARLWTAQCILLITLGAALT